MYRFLDYKKDTIYVSFLMQPFLHGLSIDTQLFHHLSGSKNQKRLHKILKNRSEIVTIENRSICIDTQQTGKDFRGNCEKFWSFFVHKRAIFVHKILFSSLNIADI